MRFLIGILFASLFTFAANAQDSPFRKELKRANLTGTNIGAHHQHLRDQARGHLNSPHPSWRGVILRLGRRHD